MKKYVILSIEESGPFERFQSSILVKVNPVEIVNYGFGDRGKYTASECEDTLWLVFKKNPCTNNLIQLKNYAIACESGVFLGIDIENWFEEKEILVNENGNISHRIVFVSKDHDEYFDEMEYYYQHHANEEYYKFKEERYIENQRRRRDAGLMYDDYIDSLDRDYDW
jgi:hypothetical protein